jgi:hypothetical protein
MRKSEMTQETVAIPKIVTSRRQDQRPRLFKVLIYNGLIPMLMLIRRGLSLCEFRSSLNPSKPLLLIVNQLHFLQV